MLLHSVKKLAHLSFRLNLNLIELSEMGHLLQGILIESGPVGLRSPKDPLREAALREK